MTRPDDIVERVNAWCVFSLSREAAFGQTGFMGGIGAREARRGSFTAPIDDVEAAACAEIHVSKSFFGDWASRKDGRERGDESGIEGGLGILGHELHPSPVRAKERLPLELPPPLVGPQSRIDVLFGTGPPRGQLVLDL